MIFALIVLCSANHRSASICATWCASLMYIDDKGDTMKGIVKFINPARGMIAIETETNDLTVAEILEVSCNVEVGDEIIGNLDNHEGEELTNITKNETMDVYIGKAMGSGLVSCKNELKLIKLVYGKTANERICGICCQRLMRQVFYRDATEREI